MSHEDLTREEEVEGSSDRSFGIVFAVVFLIVAFLPLLHSGAVRWWSVGVSAAFAVVAFTVPSILAVPNRLWMKFGLLLAKIVSPIALGILFYLVFTPIGLLMRLSGKDPMRLKADPNAKSYWIDREPPGPPPQSMTNQF
ncbi:SxtJ family membrane protein [Piscinibacter gummiphilus]|uniref:SxtJ family membrane protein n=1 Tax=Piscinibacter gummiphilus TaxID=946333 RepID=A0ABZ0CQM3_9BURK|nr:SxtJ family membrane protein [Piscinibacter gummiphilus]WOB07285.1 SxtJ family membrane protein [Piscinibacter gummiphilus]